MGFEGEEEENLKQVLEIGVISESSSDWASAPVLVRKRDGSVRYCVDYRSLNAKTVKDLFPLPSMSQCLDQLSGNIHFSTLDMARGYWQIEIDENDQHKRAFITKYRLFEHKRMAFGICNAPATFQRVIQFVLRGLTWNKTLAYINDMIVLGKDFTDHVTNLELTFQSYCQHNLKLKPKKCSLFHTKTTFLGHMVSFESVAVNPDNITKVKKWPIAQSVKDEEKFLGFVNYHHDHIHDYARPTFILYKLTGNKATFEWQESQQEAFDCVKEKLVKGPILAYPNATDIFILDTDASGTAIGAVLSQLQDGDEKVISYGSYVLILEQRKYCVTRRELLAVVRITRQFRHYLLGRKFYLRTELAIWLEKLSQFDMTVQHQRGNRHGNADGLSRIPDEASFCNCYQAGVDLADLLC